MTRIELDTSKKGGARVLTDREVYDAVAFYSCGGMLTFDNAIEAVRRAESEVIDKMIKGAFAPWIVTTK